MPFLGSHGAPLPVCTARARWRLARRAELHHNRQARPHEGGRRRAADAALVGRVALHVQDVLPPHEHALARGPQAAAGQPREHVQLRSPVRDWLAAALLARPYRARRGAVHGERNLGCGRGGGCGRAARTRL
eukprot:2468758-Prymnesium_polylepis.1